MCSNYSQSRPVGALTYLPSLTVPVRMWCSVWLQFSAGTIDVLWLLVRVLDQKTSSLSQRQSRPPISLLLRPFTGRADTDVLRVGGDSLTVACPVVVSALSPSVCRMCRAG